MGRPRTFFFAACLSLALVACGSEPPPSPGTSRPGPSSQAGAIPQDAGAPSAGAPAQGLSYAPQPLANCGGDQVVDIHWDLAAVGESRSVDILLVDRAGTERLFARSGLTGSKLTGPWAEPGQVFIARDPDTGQEMARVTLQGAGC